MQNLLRGPGVSLDEMVTTANAVFYSHDHEREARAQEWEKQKETRHTQVCLQNIHSHILEALNGLLQKTLNVTDMCLSVGHWAKKCPNHNTLPQMPCYQCKAAGHLVALCPLGQRALTPEAATALRWSSGLKLPASVIPTSRGHHHWTGVYGMHGYGS